MIRQDQMSSKALAQYPKNHGIAIIKEDKMKTIVAVLIAVAITLVVGSAFAADDQLVFMGSKDTGTSLYEGYASHEAGISGIAAGGPRAVDPKFEAAGSDEVPFMNTIELGKVLDVERPEHAGKVGMSGAAAGGVRSADSRLNEYTSDTLRTLTPIWR